MAETHDVEAAVGVSILPSIEDNSFTCVFCGGATIPLYAVDYPLQRADGMSSSSTTRVLDGMCQLCALVQHLPAKTESELLNFYSQQSEVLGNFVLFSSPDDSTFRDNQANYIEDRLGKVFGDTRSLLILEAGSFNGRLLTKLLDRGLNAYGIDVSYPPDALPPGIQERVFHGLMNQSFSSKQVLGALPNVIVASHVLEHTADPYHFLRTCAGQLAEGGVVILEVPDVLGASTHYFAPFTSLEHTFNFSESTLTMVAEHAGFRVLDVSRYRGEPVVGSVLRATLTKSESRSLVSGDRFDKLSPKTYASVMNLVQEHQANIQDLATSIEAFVRQIWNKPLALYGAGVAGYRMSRLVRMFGKPIDFFVDSDISKHNSSVEGIRVHPPSRLAQFEGVVIVASSAYAKEIEDSVRAMNSSLAAWSPWMSKDD